MRGVLYGFHNGSRLDFRNVNIQDRSQSPFLFADKVGDANVKLVMSWHGFQVYDEGVDIGAAVINFLHYVGEKGCCKRCLAGFRDTITLANKLEALREDNISDKKFKQELNEAIDFAKSIRPRAKCSFAPSSVDIVIHILEEFPEEFRIKRANKAEYHFHMSAPCTSECPAHIQIPEFIDAIRTKRFPVALKTIREDMPFPGLCGKICPHPCMSICRRGENDQVINIMSLKHSAYYDEFQKGTPNLPEKLPATSKKAAVIGMGPAGLSAAYYLALLGHSVDIYDEHDMAGGMAQYGIPRFRYDRNSLKYEIELVKSLGVNFFYGKKLGRDFDLAKLLKDYDSTLLAIGAWKPHSIALEDSENIEGIYNGVDYLEKVTSGEVPFENSRVIVVGGGNTAMDCARTARRHNNNVTIVYRRKLEEMPAEEYEIDFTLEEDVKLKVLSLPYKVYSKNGKLTGIECHKMKLGQLDASGRASPEIIPNENFKVDCDYLIYATGQNSDMSFAKESDGLKLTKWNTIEIDPIYFSTSVKSVFAAGDCIDGKNTVVRAIGNGKRAALMMSRFMLKGEPYLEPSEVMEHYLYANNIFSYGEVSDPETDYQSRKMPRVRPPEERVKDFDEVEAAFDPYTAAIEARRCLRCKRVGMFATEKE